MKRSGIYTGFTLIEAMLAVLILGIAAAAVTAPFTSGLQVREEASKRSLGVKLAAELMEQQLNLSYDQLVDNVGKTVTEQQGQLMDGDADYARFSRAVQYSAFGQDTPQGPRAVMITVTVEYQNRHLVQLKRLAAYRQTEVEIE